MQADVAKTIKRRGRRRLHGLEDQVESANQYFRSWQSEKQSDELEPIMLVGHSIGAHVAFTILKEQGGKALGVAALFPFLQFNQDSFMLAWQDAALRIPLAQRSVSSLGTLLCLLPIKPRRWIMRGGVKNMDDEYALLTLNSLLPRRMLR